MAVTVQSHPTSVVCLLEGSITLSVSATGIGTLSYQWYKNGSSLVGQVSPQYVVSSAQMLDCGTYYCEISDDYETVQSNQCTVYVDPSKGLIPKLLSNSYAGYSVYATSQVIGSNDAFAAFNKDVSSGGWMTYPGITFGQIRLDCPGQILVRKYRVYCNDVSFAPKDWILEGSVNGGSWITLDSRVNISNWEPNSWLEFNIPTIELFSKYRLTVFSVQTATASSRISIAQLELFSNYNLSAVVSVPTPGSRFIAGSPVPISVIADADSGAISAVSVYANGQQVLNATSEPFSGMWTPSSSGLYTVVATTLSGSERVSSRVFQIVVDEAVVSNPPTVILSSPADGFIFRQGSAVLIEYSVLEGDSHIASVGLYVDEVLVTSLPALTKHRYSLLGLAVGSHDIIIRATDGDGLTGESEEPTISIVAPAVSDTVIGTAMSVAAEAISHPEISGADNYVWRLWDGTCKVTSRNTIQNTANRGNLTFEARVLDNYGRMVYQTATTVEARKLPRVLSSFVGIKTVIYPFIVSVFVESDVVESYPRFVWRDKDGRVLAQSDPPTDKNGFTLQYKVESKDDFITLEVLENDVCNSSLKLDFAVPAYENRVQKIAPIATGARPTSWTKIVDPVFAACAENMYRLRGCPTVDGIQIPPVWKKIASSFVLHSASRVFAFGQVKLGENGIYIADSTPVTFNYSTSQSFQAGYITLDVSSKKLRISLQDSASTPCKSVMESHCSAGRNITLISGSNFVEYAISKVTDNALGLILDVAEVDRYGTLSSTVTTEFSWILTQDAVEYGETCLVKYGSTIGGKYLSVVTDKSSNVPQNHFVKAAVADIDYSGSRSPGSRLYVDTAVSSTDGLNGQFNATYAGIRIATQTEGNFDSLVRTKIASDNIDSGLYRSEARIEDVNDVSGFVPKSASTKAAIQIT